MVVVRIVLPSEDGKRIYKGSFYDAPFYYIYKLSAEGLELIRRVDKSGFSYRMADVLVIFGSPQEKLGIPLKVIFTELLSFEDIFNVLFNYGDEIESAEPNARFVLYSNKIKEV